ncbi:hypothetical protein BH23PLA1_BH23PLA1_37730 [soil metagenome]
MADSIPPAQPPEVEEARRRIGRASAALLGMILAALSMLSALLIWHLVRRGRIVRQRLGPPRPIQWPDLEVRDRSTDPEEPPATRPRDVP